MLARFKRFISQKFQIAKQKSKILGQKALKVVDKHPLRSFFVALGVVLVLIVISSLLPQSKPAITAAEVIKKVDTYHIGNAPKVTVQAQIKKSGVIQIVAQTSGVVSMIHTFEGTKIKRGTPLLNISSNFYGGNTASLQRQIAQKQDESVQATYPIQKDLIQKQKDLAQRADENSDQMRDIASKSNEDTRGLIDLNQQIINVLDQTLQDPATSPAVLATTRQTKSQYLATLNQARSALRSSEQQAAGDKPPAQIADLTRETTIKQLEIQEKQLDINKEVTHLQLLLAQVNEGIYYPSAPFSGVVERVFVKQFETVTAGTPLMIISQTKEEDPITAVAFVSKDIAARASRLEQSVLHIGDETISVQPAFISTEAVEGSLYAIYYPIPDSLNSKLTNEGFITVDVPVGYADTSAVATFVPIDAVYQTRGSAYIYVVNNDKTKAKEVVLGQVMGRFVEVESGLESNDVIILNRNVIEGDKIEAIGTRL